MKINTVDYLLLAETIWLPGVFLRNVDRRKLMSVESYKLVLLSYMVIIVCGIVTMLGIINIRGIIIGPPAEPEGSYEFSFVCVFSFL